MRTNNTNHLNDWELLQKRKGNTSDGDENLQQIWEHSESYGKTFQPDVEAGLSKLKNKISISPQIAKRIQMRQWLRMAAAVLVIGLAGIATFRHFSAEATPIAWIDVKTADDEQREFILPDGSNITLNENSQLSYASHINSAEQRLVRLEGEAFFDVNRRPEQAFIIQTTQTEIEVLGTSFNVRAYSNETQTEVEVSTGRVAFRDLMTQQESILYAKQAAIIDANHNITAIAAPALNRRAWKTGVLSFKETDVQAAIPLIARYFDVQLNVSTELLSCTITGNWENETLENVFVYIEGLTGLKIEQISNKVYRITGDCN